jgi:hypothetical protein
VMSVAGLGVTADNVSRPSAKSYARMCTVPYSSLRQGRRRGAGVSSWLAGREPGRAAAGEPLRHRTAAAGGCARPPPASKPSPSSPSQAARQGRQPGKAGSQAGQAAGKAGRGGAPREDGHARVVVQRDHGAGRQVEDGNRHLVVVVDLCVGDLAPAARRQEGWWWGWVREPAAAWRAAALRCARGRTCVRARACVRECSSRGRARGGGGGAPPLLGLLLPQGRVGEAVADAGHLRRRGRRGLGSTPAGARSRQGARGRCTGARRLTSASPGLSPRSRRDTASAGGRAGARVSAARWWGGQCFHSAPRIGAH